ncbi:hypothetical protein [Winogradskyella sp. 3972H.M.0a.05]|uniref:hypothetical protein n=1 Tax=Winogradskyella sp. 3972H.M.0a.05 TaxID=2950277 RepID=UPI0033946496
MFTFKKKTEVQEDAQFIFDIVKKYSGDSNIKKLVAPGSGECYLIDSENEITISIADEKVMISNHVFLYKKLFNLSFTDQLKKQVKSDIKKEVALLKKSLLEDETNLLSNISRLNSGESMPENITSVSAS